MAKIASGKDQGILPRWADVGSQMLVIYSIITFTLESEPAWQGHPFFYYSEVVVLILFSIEYLSRLYLASDRWKYVKSFYGMIDLIAIAPAIITFGFFDLRFARIIRLLRLIRLLKLFRYVKAVDTLKESVNEVKGELIVFMFSALGIVYVASVGIYYLEHDIQPEHFGSITRSMWWGVVTLTTVGYGDTYPVTAAGKLFTAMILCVGVCIVAVPSGLIASGLMKSKMDKAMAESEAKTPSTARKSA